MKGDPPPPGSDTFQHPYNVIYIMQSIIMVSTEYYVSPQTYIYITLCIWYSLIKICYNEIS